MDLKAFYLRIPPEHIVLLKFLVESYEGLGVLRTLNRHTGEVVVLAPFESEETVGELLEELRGELSLEDLEIPEGAGEDWLLYSETGHSEE